ncbi:MarR family winged helix-turn-helix transcriptional regulator [Blastochloris viridis]|uniref:Salmolysin n=1 Tax=Blastochloris viridis TaxID=1079 RepID=A0A0H5BEM7_BLAVI|nr:MarR family transcriptional regulator [Blastochloris viridis]ALK09451.1 Transcriptional regulator SlyA [Blastochloris viridis]BAS00668.1 transcriptional regulator [Blastochloris viridis]CUU42114.1 Salmolysin [Blastochloris viridis]
MSVRKGSRQPVAPLEGTRRGGAPARSAAIDEADDAATDTDALDLSGLNAVVGYALRRAQLAVFEDFIARFAVLDLKPAQYSVLLVIGENPGRKQAEIAATLGIQRPNFVAMLDELERRGLAERMPSATDRRSHALVLTRAGNDLLARARALQDEQERELARRLGPGGRETLVALLQRLV